MPPGRFGLDQLDKGGGDHQIRHPDSLLMPISLSLRPFNITSQYLIYLPLRMPIPFYKPTPSPPNAFQGVPLPRSQANWLSTLFFHRITPVLRIGYSRPLEAEGKLVVTRRPIKLTHRSMGIDTGPTMPAGGFLAEDHMLDRLLMTHSSQPLLT